MIIKRELQHATWEFDSAENKVILSVDELQTVGMHAGQRITKQVTLDKTYIFSLARFLIRSMQKMSQKERKKVLQKEDSSAIVKE